MTNNIDAGLGADAHKVFDLVKPQSVSWEKYLLYLFNQGTEEPETTWKRISQWTSMKTAPEEVKEILRPFNPEI